MKKKLKAELVSLAHHILQMNATADYAAMQREAKNIYDTLTVLAFAERHFDGVKPTIGKADIIEALQNKDADEVEEIIEEVKVTPVPRLEKPAPSQDENVKRLEEIARANEIIFERARSRKAVPQTFQESRAQNNEVPAKQSKLHEPVMEKIKDMVAQMPPEADQIEDMFQEITGGQKTMKNDKDDIGEWGRLAEFEEKKPAPEKPEIKESPKEARHSAPIKREGYSESKQKSLNDRLNKGLSIGLNDRIVLIKYLFNGSTADYNRVLSQLNTQNSTAEAIRFIDQMVKPDYDNWDGKEVYEQRFKELVEKKFDD